MLWVVAGCLFEVSLPLGGEPWRWTDRSPAVTLLSEDDRDGQRHLRFRAEAPGRLQLQFAGGSGERVAVAVHVAPERLD